MSNEAMEEKDLWLKKVKEKLGDYSEPIPASGWEQLEKKLSNRKHIYPYRKWAVAAAATVLVAVSAVSLFFLQSPEAETVRRISSTAAFVPDELPGQPTPQVTDSQEKPIETVRKLQPVLAMGAPLKVDTVSQSVDTGSVAATDSDSIPVEVENKSATTVQEDKAHETKQGTEKRTTTVRPPSAKVKPLIAQHTRNRNDWSVGMAMGGLGSGSMGNNNDQVVYGSRNNYMSFNPSSAAAGFIKVPDNQSLDMKNGAPLLQATDEVIDAKHKQPLNFGLSIRKELAKGFSIESGLTYTLLSSEIITTTSSSWQEQKLHYIGIPVRAGWSFYQRERLTLYTSAGGTVEKCIYGKLDSEKQTVNEFQFSVGGAVGAQLNLSKRLGLYVEPGVMYYFDDGSSVETIRKEKPFNFNLQAGFRLSY